MTRTEEKMLRGIISEIHTESAKLKIKIDNLKAHCQQVETLLIKTAYEFVPGDEHYCPVCFSQEHNKGCFYPVLKNFMGWGLNKFDIECLEQRPD